MHKTIIISLIAISLLVIADGLRAGERKKVHIKSTVDGTMQPAYVILPDGFEPGGKPRPLLVSLHTWSNGVEQRQPHLEKEAARLGWIYLFPHFRGPNRNPKACASPEARQDIIDALDWALEKYPIDKRRIYLCGASGGGHMALTMAGRFPKRWTAVSAWVPISNLAAWWRFHGDKSYGLNVVAVCCGRPGDSAEVDRQYFERSPINFLNRAVGLPLEIAAGVHDGHKGSVPIRHTLEAYNVLAKAQGKPEITEKEIRQLSRPKGRLENPLPSDQIEDPTFKRAIYLRRQAGNTRVTIFEGGHERLAHAAVEWLKGHVKEP
ncbi:MAG: prolyl oligopeptidase family serine peptidase [Pirellulales bacterium]|nr:prolyl oligopeptidase family serine peptidase [Pirellulales bacterium]